MSSKMAEQHDQLYAVRSQRPTVALVIFACEGREYLAQQTIASLNDSVRFPFTNTMIVVDGALNRTLLREAPADLIVQRPQRGGYLRNILSALALIECEYFFWVEDDWQFLEPVDIEAMLRVLIAHSQVVQVRLSKTGRLTTGEKTRRVAPDVYVSQVGFSANPCLCRTALVREAFEFVKTAPRGASLGIDGFENIVTRYLDERGLICAAIDSRGVEHLGYLESTPRQFHMTASLDGEIATYLPVSGSRPPVWRRVVMTGKLARRFASVAVRQLRDDECYDLAFRMVTVPLRSGGGA
jgi:hypothetical protein